MTAFNNLIGKEILSIQRIDAFGERASGCPHAIILNLEDQFDRLVLSAFDGAVTIEVLNDDQIAYDHGIDDSECDIHELANDDVLCKLIGDRVQKIEVDEHIIPKLTGSNYVTQHRFCTSIALITSRHKLLFRNDYGNRVQVNSVES